MKQLLVTFSLMLIGMFASAQCFEGKIIYKNSFKSKAANITDQQITAMMGDVQNYYIDAQGDYKSQTNGTFMQWQLYINKDNKIYNKFSNSENLFYNDAAVNDDVLTNVEIHKGVLKVLGYQCDELVWTTKTGVQKYYFSSKVPFNSKLFVNHKFGDWYAYMEKANALPLKIYIETPQFNMESIATEITPMKVDKATFALPTGAKVVKSPF